MQHRSELALLRISLQHIYLVRVTVASKESWTLLDTVVIDAGGSLLQVDEADSGVRVTEIGSPEEVAIPGEYPDLVSTDLAELRQFRGLGVISRLTTFYCRFGLFGIEAEAEAGGFAIQLYPEDLEVARGGAVWDQARSMLPEVTELVVTHHDASRSS